MSNHFIVTVYWKEIRNDSIDLVNIQAQRVRQRVEIYAEHGYCVDSIDTIF